MCPSVPKWAHGPKCAQKCPRVHALRVTHVLCLSELLLRPVCIAFVCAAGVCLHEGPSVPKWAHGPTCAHVCTNEMAAVVNVTQLRPCHATNENACIHAWRVFIGGHTCGHMSIGHMPALSSCPSGGLCALFFKHRRVSWHDVHPGYVPGCSRGNIFLTWAQSGHSGPIGGMGTVAPMGTVGPMTHR